MYLNFTLKGSNDNPIGEVGMHGGINETRMEECWNGWNWVTGVYYTILFTLYIFNFSMIKSATSNKDSRPPQSFS